MFRNLWSKSLIHTIAIEALASDFATLLHTPLSNVAVLAESASLKTFEVLSNLTRPWLTSIHKQTDTVF